MQQHPTTDFLDDIFSSSPPVPSHQAPEPELSDLPSLRRQHVTTGYRNGIATSKNAHIQDGFDAGFPVGAQLGMRAGTILGILEGLVRGYDGDQNRFSGSGGVVRKTPQRGTSTGTGVIHGEGNKISSSSSSSDEKERETRNQIKEKILGIYHDASRELSVQEVFAGTEPVSSGGSSGGNGEGKEKDSPEHQLQQRADPVISRWEKRAMVSQWEENMEALEEKDSDREGKKTKLVEQS